jgi:hypothetical protein
MQWLTLIPIAPLRLFLSFAATLLSAFFLIRNLYPVLATAPNVSARLLVVVIGVLHLALGMGLWWGFLAGGSGVLHSGAGGLGEAIGGGGAGTGSTGGAEAQAAMRWSF